VAYTRFFILSDNYPLRHTATTLEWRAVGLEGYVDTKNYPTGRGNRYLPHKWTHLVSKPGLRGERSETNRLNYGRRYPHENSHTKFRKIQFLQFIPYRQHSVFFTQTSHLILFRETVRSYKKHRAFTNRVGNVQILLMLQQLVKISNHMH
jgi:hypothetical protein